MNPTLLLRQVSFDDKLKFCFDLTGDEDVNKTEFLATFINANKAMSREEAKQEVDKIFEKVSYLWFTLGAWATFHIQGL